MMRKIVAIAISCILCITFAPLSFAEDNNLLKDRNPGFENLLFGGLGLENWNFGGGVEQENCIIKSVEADPEQGIKENLAHGGEYFVNLPTNGAAIHSTSFPLEPEKTYALSFWVRSSVKNAGQIDLRYYVAGKMYNVYCADNFIKYVNGEHLFQEYFGLEKPAPQEGEEDTRMEWYKVSFNFTTPPLTEAAILNIYNRASDGDPFLCLDDFYLAEEEELNYIKNGGFEHTKGPDILSSWKHLSTGDGTFTLIDDAERGKVLKTTGGSLQISTSLPLRPGRWKLSFDHKPDVSSAYHPTVYMSSSAPPETGWVTGWKPAQRAFSRATWTTYEYYFTVPHNIDPTSNYYRINDFRIGVGWGADNHLDNIKVVPATSAANFSVYNSFSTKNEPDLAYISDNARYTEKISTGNLKDNEHEIGINAHYIPKTTGEENFRLTGALYRIYDNGKIELERVTFINGSTNEGKQLSVSGKIYVPKLSGGEGYTYRLKAFMTGETLLDAINKTTSFIEY